MDQTTGSPNGNGVASSKAGKAQAAVQDTFRSAEHAFQRGLEEGRAQLGEAAETAQRQLREVQGYVSREVQARPLTAAAIAAGVGVLLGLILGGSRRR